LIADVASEAFGVAGRPSAAVVQHTPARDAVHIAVAGHIVVVGHKGRLVVVIVGAHRLVELVVVDNRVVERGLRLKDKLVVELAREKMLVKGKRKENIWCWLGGDKEGPTLLFHLHFCCLVYR
jgi:hypothetical protein